MSTNASLLSVLQNKRSNFRKQIRRKQLFQNISLARDALIASLEHKDLVSLLGRLKEEGAPTQGELDYILSILQSSSQKATFNLDLRSDKLQCFMWRMLKEDKITSLADKTTVLASLTCLTYFCEETTRNIIDQHLVDYLRVQITTLHLQHKDHLNYLQSIVCLVMNLSSTYQKEFNLFIAESDFSMQLNKAVARTLNITKDDQYKETVHSLRSYILRLYKNILNYTYCPASTAVQLIYSTFSDRGYYDAHNQALLNLLSEAMHIDEFWRLTSQNAFFLQLLSDLGVILDSIQTTLTPQFAAVINLLNAMSGIDTVECSWLDCVVNFLNPYMLADYTLQEQKSMSRLRNALKLYRELAREESISVEQILMVREDVQKDALLILFTQEQIIRSKLCGGLCFEIIKNLIKKDGEILYTLIEMRIVEHIQYAIQGQEDSVFPCLIDVMALMLQVDTKKKLIRIFLNKGIVNKVQKLQDSLCRDIARRAQNFMILVQGMQKEQQK